MIKKRLADIDSKTYFTIYFTLIIVLLLLYFLGNFININVISLGCYIFFLLFLYALDPIFLMIYSWCIIMISLNILGVFICDTLSVYIGELNICSVYSNALTPLIICYVLFLGVIEFICVLRRHSRESIDFNDTKEGDIVQVLLLVIGIVAIIILFSQVIFTPFFAEKVNRIVYAQTYMSSWERRLKPNLVLLIPVVLMCWDKQRKLVIAFFILLFTYYLWTGDKFGAFCLALYIVVLSTITTVNKAKLRGMFIWALFIIIMLLSVFYVQRFFAGDGSLDGYLSALLERAICQGDIWWSINFQERYEKSHLFEFIDELRNLLPVAQIDETRCGQWKIVFVATFDEQYTYYRYLAKNPYTCSTMSSLLYYFGMSGTFLLYIFGGIVYEQLIWHSRKSISSRRVIESMVCIKLIVFFHNLLFSSDMTFFSFKGLILFTILIIFAIMRKKGIHLIFANKSRYRKTNY